MPFPLLNFFTEFSDTVPHGVPAEVHDTELFQHLATVHEQGERSENDEKVRQCWVFNSVQ